MTRIVLLAMLIVGASACSSPPELRMAGDNKVGAALASVAYEQHRSIGSIPICLTEPGSAIITGVAIHEATGDIRVQAFAVRPNPFVRGIDGVGTDERTLAEIGEGFAPGAIQEVSAVCPTADQMDDESVTAQVPEFAIQVSWSSGGLAGGTGIDLTYEIDGSRHTSRIPMAVWVCSAECPDDLPNGGVGL